MRLWSTCGRRGQSHFRSAAAKIGTVPVNGYPNEKQAFIAGMRFLDNHFFNGLSGFNGASAMLSKSFLAPG